MSGNQSNGARRGREFFRELLSEHDGSGLTLKALAESKGIKPATLYTWSRRLREADRPPKPVPPRTAPKPQPLVPVHVVEKQTGRVAGDPARVELVVRGDVEVRVPETFDERALVALVEALRRGC